MRKETYWMSFLLTSPGLREKIAGSTEDGEILFAEPNQGPSFCPLLVLICKEPRNGSGQDCEKNRLLNTPDDDLFLSQAWVFHSPLIKIPSLFYQNLARRRDSLPLFGQESPEIGGGPRELKPETGKWLLLRNGTDIEEVEQLLHYKSF